MADGVEFLLEFDAELKEATAAEDALVGVEKAAMGADFAMKGAEKSTTAADAAMGKAARSTTRAAKAAGSAEKATQKLGNEVSKTERQMGLLGRATTGAGSAMIRFGRDALAHFTALASFQGLARLATFITDLGKAALQSAGEAERTTKSFELMMGVKPANELLAFIDDVAKHTEFTDDALKGFAAEFLNAGFSGERLKDALAATVDLAALTTDKMEGAAKAVMLFRNVRLKEGITEKQLVAANLNPKEVFGRVAKDLGLGIDEVEKRIQEGKVDVGVMLNALNAEIMKETGHALGGAGKVQSGGMLAMLEKVSELPGEFAEDLSKTDAFAKLKTQAADFLTAFDPSSERGKRIATALEDMATKFATMLDRFNADEVADSLVRAFEVLPGLVEMTMKGMRELLKLAGATANFFLALRRDATPEDHARPGIGATVGKAGHALLGAVEDILTVGHLMEKLGFTGQQAGGAMATGVADGLRAGLPAVERAGAAVAGAAEGGVRKEAEIRSPSRVFADLGLQTSMGFSVGVQDAIPDVRGTVEHAFALPTILPAAAAMPSMGAPAIDMPSIGPLVGPAGAPPAGGGGGGSIHAEMHFHFGGSPGSTEQAREMGKEAGAAAREELMRLFEQAQFEGA